MIARALDKDEFVLVPSLDLSSAFNMAKIDLLQKDLKIIGLPEEILSLVEV
jgi:hypothetical protein